MKYTCVSLILAGTLLSMPSTRAHHSWPAVFKDDTVISIEGVVMEFLYRSPHSWLFVEVKNADGKLERWDVEMGPAMAYARMGITKDTLKPGDKLLISGNPGRKNPRWVHMIGIYRSSDGWMFGKDPRVKGEE